MKKTLSTPLHCLSVMISQDELRSLLRLCLVKDVSMSKLVRRWITSKITQAEHGGSQ